MKFIDLSHRITDGLVTYPGTPAVKIDAYMTRQEAADAFGEPAQALLDRITMLNISGTYLDAPLHRFDKGYTVADIPLEKLVDLPYQVVSLKEGKNCFDTEDLSGIGIPGGAVILNSGHHKVFGTEKYGVNAPYLTPEGAQYLMDRGVVLVGIDTPLIDNMMVSSTVGCPVHDIILDAGGVVCEDLINTDLAAAAGGTGLLSAIPARVEMASFTARVFIKIN